MAETDDNEESSNKEQTADLSSDGDDLKENIDIKHKQKTDNSNTDRNFTINLKLSSFNAELADNKKTTSNRDLVLLKYSNTVKRFSPIWKQTAAASSSILVTFSCGLSAGYSAVLLPQLRHPGSSIPGDDDTASWIASMAALPMAVGCLVSGWMMERLGRKTSQMVVCAPLLLGWVLIACAQGLTLMLLGRFLTGLCLGLLGPLGPVYIAETTEPKYRGFFLAGVSLAIALSILIAHLIGTFLSWQWTATIFTAFPIISVVVLAFVPESPAWLISKGRAVEGVEAFGWLRGFDDEANEELKGIIEKQKVVDSEPKMNYKERLASLKTPEFFKPLLIMILFFITNQFAGVNAVAFYSIEIVEKSVGKGLDHYVAMLVIDFMRVVMSVVACVVSKKFGRRPLCFISGTWTALSMVALSMFLYFTEGQAAEHMAWIPLTCLMSYICAVSIGLVPLPWIMCGEVFPLKTRGLGSGISSAISFAAFFLVVKTAPGMMSGLGEVVTFLLYGSVAAVGTAVMYFILPETKGKSLQQIEDKFKNVGGGAADDKV